MAARLTKRLWEIGDIADVLEAWEGGMPKKTLCPKCHGQRTTSCLACHGTGKKSILRIKIGNCKECGGTGRHRCDVCGGMGEVEP